MGSNSGLMGVFGGVAPASGFSGLPNGYPQQCGVEQRRKEKYEKRLEREERREKRGAEKRQKRENRAEEKQQKRERREQEKKQRTERKGFISDAVTEELPNDISHLFLDGNNMMFVASCLRDMTLHRNRRRAEQLIGRLAIQFLGAAPKAISKTTLVFDDTRAKSELTLRAATQEPQEFELCSARPRFTTSDDAIVQWISDVSGTPGVKLSVTSDRGLIERIEKEGGKVMKPKKWMLTAATLIAGHEVSNLDTWMDQWCNSQIDL